MTKDERIAQLERRIATLEARIATLEARPMMPAPVIQPYQPPRRPGDGTQQPYPRSPYVTYCADPEVNVFH